MGLFPVNLIVLVIFIVSSVSAQPRVPLDAPVRGADINDEHGGTVVCAFTVLPLPCNDNTVCVDSDAPSGSRLNVCEGGVWVVSSGPGNGGGGSNPAGPLSSVQFHDVGGLLGGNLNFIWDTVNNEVQLGAGAAIVGADAQMVVAGTDAVHLEVGGITRMTIDSTGYKYPNDPPLKYMFLSAGLFRGDGVNCDSQPSESVVLGAGRIGIGCSDEAQAGTIRLVEMVVMDRNWDLTTLQVEAVWEDPDGGSVVAAGDVQVRCRGNGEPDSDNWGDLTSTDATLVAPNAPTSSGMSADVVMHGTCADHPASISARWVMDNVNFDAGAINAEFRGIGVLYGVVGE